LARVRASARAACRRCSRQRPLLTGATREKVRGAEVEYMVIIRRCEPGRWCMRCAVMVVGEAQGGGSVVRW